MHAQFPKASLWYPVFTIVHAASHFFYFRVNQVSSDSFIDTVFFNLRKHFSVYGKQTITYMYTYEVHVFTKAKSCKIV